MPTLPINGYYLTFALLIGCTIVGITVAARWRREVDVDLAPTTTKELLGPLEQAYYSGLMHPAEIERVRESVKKVQPAPPAPLRVKAKPAQNPDPGLILPSGDGGFMDQGHGASGDSGSDAG